ncbi:MAG: hypothetical protein QM214_04545 [Bacillota bacterium]|jgi:hypothetical protein|nr:hypothetical protein [Bacillota bacterium]
MAFFIGKRQPQKGITLDKDFRMWERELQKGEAKLFNRFLIIIKRQFVI